MIPAEPVASVVARGDAELGFQQISELLPIAGADLVGPLPPEVQKITIFSAGITANANQPEAGKALIAFLASAAAAPASEKSGSRSVCSFGEIDGLQIGERTILGAGRLNGRWGHELGSSAAWSVKPDKTLRTRSFSVSLGLLSLLADLGMKGNFVMKQYLNSFDARQTLVGRCKDLRLLFASRGGEERPVRTSPGCRSP